MIQLYILHSVLVLTATVLNTDSKTSACVFVHIRVRIQISTNSQSTKHTSYSHCMKVKIWGKNGYKTIVIQFSTSAPQPTSQAYS